MESSHLCLATYIALVPVVAVADDPAPAIISNWHEATADTTTVRASVRLIQYDDTFHTQKHATGTFGYLSPRHGFWRLNNDTTEHQKLRVTLTGVPYKIQPFDNRHWRWHAERFRDINDKDKSFPEYKIDPNTNSYVRIFSLDLFRTVDWATPFLPGHPNKDGASQWTYSVTKQTDSHAWVRATPEPDTLLGRSWACWDLHFRRDPARLLATHSTSVFGARQTTILYSNVKFNPEPWPEPDLAEYKQTNMPVQ